MFGLSFGELVVVIIVAIAVIGPKDMPRVLRSAGQWAGRLRRMAAELRVQSGIDDVLREGSIRQDIEEIRKLARGELDMMQREMRVDAVRPLAPAPQASDAAPLAPTFLAGPVSDVVVDREREFPRDGADTYGALPDTAIVYDGSFPASKWAKDEVYMTGVVFAADEQAGAQEQASPDEKAPTDETTEAPPPAAPAGEQGDSA